MVDTAARVGTPEGYPLPDPARDVRDDIMEAVGRARAVRQDLVPQDLDRGDRRRSVRRLRRLHRRVPVEVDRHRRRRPPDARPDVHRLLGVLGLLPDGRHARREAQRAGRGEPDRRADADGVGACGRATGRRAGRRRRHDPARDADGARRHRRGDPDAEAGRLRRHAGPGDDARAGADRRGQRLPPVRDARDLEREGARGRRADRVRRARRARSAGCARSSGSRGSAARRSRTRSRSRSGCSARARSTPRS